LARTCSITKLYLLSKQVYQTNLFFSNKLNFHFCYKNKSTLIIEWIYFWLASVFILLHL